MGVKERYLRLRAVLRQQSGGVSGKVEYFELSKRVPSPSVPTSLEETVGKDNVTVDRGFIRIRLNPDSVPVTLALLEEAFGSDAGYDKWWFDLRAQLTDVEHLFWFYELFMSVSTQRFKAVRIPSSFPERLKSFVVVLFGDAGTTLGLPEVTNYFSVLSRKDLERLAEVYGPFSSSPSGTVPDRKELCAVSVRVHREKLKALSRLGRLKEVSLGYEIQYPIAVSGDIEKDKITLEEHEEFEVQVDGNFRLPGNLVRGLGSLTKEFEEKECTPTDQCQLYDLEVVSKPLYLRSVPGPLQVYNFFEPSLRWKEAFVCKGKYEVSLRGKTYHLVPYTYANEVFHVDPNNGLSKNSCRRSKFLANTVNMCHRGTTISFLYPSHVDNAFHRYFHDGYFRGFPVEDVVHWFGAYSRQN